VTPVLKNFFEKKNVGFFLKKCGIFTGFVFKKVVRVVTSAIYFLQCLKKVQILRDFCGILRNFVETPVGLYVTWFLTHVIF